MRVMETIAHTQGAVWLVVGLVAGVGCVPAPVVVGEVVTEEVECVRVWAVSVKLSEVKGEPDWNTRVARWLELGALMSRFSVGPDDS